MYEFIEFFLVGLAFYAHHFADYCKSDIFNEALNQTRVEETGLFIPKVHEVKRLDDGRLALVLSISRSSGLPFTICEAATIGSH